MAKLVSKPTCTRGTACGYSCISGKYSCSDRVQKSDAEALLHAGATAAYRSWPVLASGNYGSVQVSPDGSRVAKLAKSPDVPAFGKHEVELAVAMAAKGHSPAVYSSSDSHIEMALAKGKTLWADHRPEKDAPSATAGQAAAMAAALTDLHRLGYSHGDAHSQQFLFDGDKLTLLDYGLSKPALESPRTLLQDFNKVNRLANWDNSELDGDANVQLIRKYRAAYAAAGKNKAKETAVAESYYRELTEG